MAHVKVLIYSVSTPATQNQPLTRSVFATLKNRARRRFDLASWQMTGRWYGHYSTFEDASNSNRGDIAIREAVESTLRHAAGRPLEIVEFPWDMNSHEAIRAAAQDARGLIVAGSGYFHVNAAGFLSDRISSDIALFRELKCPVFGVALGYNRAMGLAEDSNSPLASGMDDRLRQLMAVFAVCSVRDQRTRQLLEPLSPRPLPVVVDPAFVLARERVMARSRSGTSGKLRVGLNLAFHGDTTSRLQRHKLGTVVDAIRELGRQHSCEFVYFVHSNSERVMPAALRAAGIDTEVVDGPSDQLLDAYANLDVHICQMLHSAIMACGSGTPTILMAYDIKASGFYDLLDLGEYCIELRSVSAPALIAMASKLIDRRSEVCAKLAAIGSGLTDSFMVHIREVARVILES